jgi:signal transduction histidine kinase
MNIIKKHFLAASTILGALFGYVVLHPFGDVIHELFHPRERGYLHLHWNEIPATLNLAFSWSHFPETLSYIILTGIIGFFFGKTILSYRTVNEQLKAFSKIGVNASSIAHGLSHPVTGIFGYIYLLKKQAGGPEQIDLLNNAERETTRVSKMITDIKIIARGARTSELTKEPVELKSFMEDHISDMSLHHEVKIDSSFEGQISADKDHLERVFWNLVKNADERDKLKRLFEIGRTFEKKYGSGIGLYNCKKIVEAHGGKIWLNSALNKGTTVYIKIPKNL